MKDKVVLQIKDQDSGQDKKNKNIFSQQVVAGRNLVIMPKIIKAVVLAAVVLTVLFYIGFYLKNIISFPVLEIIQPADNQTITKTQVDVIGLTESEAQVTVNGEQVLSDEKGMFVKKIDLKKGVNIIIIVAKKKYGPEKIIKKQVLVDGD